MPDSPVPLEPVAARLQQLFPTLTAAQTARIAAHGRRRSVARGDVLVDVGDKGIHFFVVVSGEIHVVQPSPGTQRLIGILRPGQFSGEGTMITGRRALARLRVNEPGEVVELDREHLLAVVQTDAELSEILMRAFILRRVEFIALGLGDVVLIGSAHCSGTLRVKEFLTRNGHPYAYIDLDRDNDAQELLDRFHITAADVPVLICRGDSVLKNPDNQRIAECLGFNDAIDQTHVRDLVIVGAGPAGLAAAVYGASEGLGCDRQPYGVQLDAGRQIASRAVIIATGAEYRRPALANLSQFEGAGVYYGATPMEAQLCVGEDVVVIGGGNAAGQAAVFLAQSVKHVHMLIRAEGLADTMSRYLIRRIEESPAITLHTHTELVALQ
jgi:thioredoxin reductase (NADPH)